MKKILRIEADVIRCNRLKKGARAMVSIASALYRTNDRYMIADCRSNDCYIIFNLDDTQPYLPKAEYCDTDHTRKIIASAKSAGNKKRVWMNLSGDNLVKYIAIIAIVGGILWGFMSYGGIHL